MVIQPVDKPTHSQLFDVLEPATLAGLRDSVQRLGVLVPIAKDQDGNVLDGHHRIQVADELGVRYRVDVIQCADDQQRDEIRRTLNVDRRQLSGDDLKRHILTLAQMREPSGIGALSPNEIAERSGVSQQYVSQVLGDPEVTSTSNLPTERRGKDGKVYKASRPAVVTAKNEREAERAQQALADLPARTGVMDVKRAEKVARAHLADQRRAEPLGVETVGSVEIRLGDFREALADMTPGSVDAIITDPPYPREFWHLLDGLGELAARVLKPEGVLAVMTGTRLAMVDEAERLLGQHLRRRHRGVYLVPGQLWSDQQEHIAVGHKPILIYAHHDSTNPRWINGDVFRSDAVQQDGRFHHWGQTESGMASLVSRLSDPGALVVDPFVGGGTTAVVCRDLGRQFIGCDNDAAAVSISRARVEEES